MNDKDFHLLGEESEIQHTLCIDMGLEELYGLDVVIDREIVDQHLRTFICPLKGVTWVYYDEHPLVVTWTEEFEGTTTTFTRLLFESL
jgi:hypothetical protein